MIWWLYIILFFQSSIQSFFLASFFESRNLLKDWLKLLFVFIIILYPINYLFLNDGIFFRNIFNFLLLTVLSKIIFKELKTIQILMGIILYELLLVISEFTALIMSYLILQRTPIFTENSSEAFLMYLFGSAILGLFSVGILNLFSKSIIQKNKIEIILFLMIINVIFTALAFISAVIPYYQNTFYFDYGSISIILSILNVLTILWLIKTAKKESEKRAIEEITSVYSSQIQSYISNEEEEIRNLRHDLLNFLESRK